jgi:hypothetical protein
VELRSLKNGGTGVFFFFTGRGAGFGGRDLVWRGFGPPGGGGGGGGVGGGGGRNVGFFLFFYFVFPRWDKVPPRGESHGAREKQAFQKDGVAPAKFSHGGGQKTHPPPPPPLGEGGGSSGGGGGGGGTAGFPGGGNHLSPFSGSHPPACGSFFFTPYNSVPAGVGGGGGGQIENKGGQKKKRIGGGGREGGGEICRGGGFPRVVGKASLFPPTDWGGGGDGSFYFPGEGGGGHGGREGGVGGGGGAPVPPELFSFVVLPLAPRWGSDVHSLEKKLFQPVCFFARSEGRWIFAKRGGKFSGVSGPFPRKRRNFRWGGRGRFWPRGQIKNPHRKKLYTAFFPQTPTPPNPKNGKPGPGARGGGNTFSRGGRFWCWRARAVHGLWGPNAGGGTPLGRGQTAGGQVRWAGKGWPQKVRETGASWGFTSRTPKKAGPKGGGPQNLNVLL